MLKTRVTKNAPYGTDPFNHQRITRAEFIAADNAVDWFSNRQESKIDEVSDFMEQYYSKIAKNASGGMWNDSEKMQRYNYTLFRDRYMHYNNKTGFWELNKGMWKQVGEGKEKHWAPKTPEELKKGKT